MNASGHDDAGAVVGSTDGSAPGRGAEGAGASPTALSADPVLRVGGLRTVFPGEDGTITVVDGVDVAVGRGETLAVVGESGSGKTMTFLSVLGLLPPGGRVTEGEVWFDGRDLTRLHPAAMRAIRGAQIAMVFQDPLTSLNPGVHGGRPVGHRDSRPRLRRKGRCEGAGPLSCSNGSIFRTRESG